MECSPPSSLLRYELEFISDSNHTCCIYSEGNIPDNKIIYSEGDPKLNRRRKLCHVLSSRNRESSNECNLYSDMRLWPDMVESVQLCSSVHSHLDDEENLMYPIAEDHIKPLSIVYEIMSGWRMPMIYGNKNKTS